MPTSAIVDSLAPGQGEAAVLSALLFRRNGEWCVASGSLLTMPAWWATLSWRMWRQFQPSEARQQVRGFDLGPTFVAEPFPDVRAVRQVVRAAEWHSVADLLEAGRIETTFVQALVPVHRWTAPVRVFPHGVSAASEVVRSAARPVAAVVGRLPDMEVPPTSADTWAWPLPPGLGPEADLAPLDESRRLPHWPRELLGIDWLGAAEFAPPRAFVVGRLLHEAWILSVRPDDDTRELVIALGWNEEDIDPIGCAIQVQSCRDGLTFADRQIRVSDLPSHSETEPESPWSRPWYERLLTVRVPRGVRRSDWGVKLYASDGRLLDELPVAKRLERIEISLTIDGAGEGVRMVAGDPDDPPDLTEEQEAVEMVRRLEEAARLAAAGRRFSDAGELEDYLRWRLAFRAGELLLLDPFALRDDRTRAEELRFLGSLKRPIRMLTEKLGRAAASHATTVPGLVAARLPAGVELHDRVWIFGESGLLVGGSITTFLPRSPGTPTRVTTATELPHADAAAWRDRFESWWAARRPPRS